VQQPQDAATLEQLVAPIALYPDALIAQMLAAATYPAQVVGADHWLQAQGYASLDQVAYGANQQSWDPSVKALTAFPQVLAQMDHDIQWTTDLGNAYYNQPQDVLQTIQMLRQSAENAGTLQNTPQESVTDNQGYIQVAPVNPQVVYVPAYNPWAVYGQPIQPYPGFSLFGDLASLAGSGPVRFGMGMGMSAFNNMPFGWTGWALNWLSQGISYHNSNYASHSTTVARWSNYPHGGLPTRTPHGLESGNRGFGGDYRGGARPATEYARSRAYDNYGRQTYGYKSGEVPNRGYQQYGNFARPAVRNDFAYNRPPQPMPGREQAYGRPGYQQGYQGGYQGGYGQSFAGHPPAGYGNQQRNDFAQRSYPSQRSFQGYGGGSGYGGSGYRGSPYGGSGYDNRGFAQPRQQQQGGSHFFGGGRGSEKSYGGYKAPRNNFKAPRFKAPKAPKEHGGGHSSGGHIHRM
jgi:hypothetical protein